jgi:lysophospholipase L1-like esterase
VGFRTNAGRGSNGHGVALFSGSVVAESANATNLQVTTQPVGGTSPNLTTQPVVTAKKSLGSTDTAYVTNVVPTLNVLTGSATLGGSEATGKACVAGVCTFTNLTVTAAAGATWTITFTSGTLASAVSNTGTTTSAPAAAQDTLLAALGTSNVIAMYDVNGGLVASASGLTSWDDYRGASGFGPTLLPLGASGAGTTGPRLSGTGSSALLVSDPSINGNQWAANASAFAGFDNSTPQTFIFVGEITGSSLFPVGFSDTTSSGSTTNYSLINNRSSTQLQMKQGTSGGTNTTTTPAVKPAAGTRIVVMASHTGDRIYRFEQFGRGTNYGAGAVQQGSTPSAGSRFLTIGGWNPTFNGTGFTVKVRAMLLLNRVMTHADRAAIEAFATDATAGHSAAISSAYHHVVCVGDSITAGAYTSVAQTENLPAGPTTGTYPNNSGPYPAVLQALCTGAAKSVDVCNFGWSGYATTEFTALTGGRTTTMIGDTLGTVSPARLSAGKQEIVVVLLGTNDLNGGGSTGAQVYSRLTTLVSNIHAVGAKAVLCTLTPRNDSAWNLTTLETERLNLNTAIRGNAAGADLVVDFRTAASSVFADPTLKATYGSNTAGDPTSFSAYYYSDQIHPNDGGTTVMGNMVYTALVGAGWI